MSISFGLVFCVALAPFDSPSTETAELPGVEVRVAKGNARVGSPALPQFLFVYGTESITAAWYIPEKPVYWGSRPLRHPWRETNLPPVPNWVREPLTSSDRPIPIEDLFEITAAHGVRHLYLQRCGECTRSDFQQVVDKVERIAKARHECAVLYVNYDLPPAEDGPPPKSDP